MATESRETLSSSSVPTVAVLMCTANGGEYLAQQLDSIAGQSFTNWRLYVSDDGSTDETVARLLAFRDRIGVDRVFLREGPRNGYVANFLSLACDTTIRADFFAFSDQDDKWHPDRLERSLNALRGLAAAQPALYCARTHYVDRRGDSLGLSPLFAQPPSFRNALVQSLGGGNTMTFNQAARALLVRAGVLPVVSHDWWLYQLVAGCGGSVVYDPRPSVDYRQHPSNLIGAGTGWNARLQRVRALLGGRLTRWNDANEQALDRVTAFLAPENRSVYELFKRGRHAGLLRRLACVIRAGVYRQTFFGTLSLWADAVVGRL